MSDERTPLAPAALSLGLAFLFVGIGFALPFSLFPKIDWALELGKAPEIYNLFCMVAWMGLAHFFFAYRGHLTASKRRGTLGFYVGVLVVSAAVLFGLRGLIGYAIFSAIAWVYFIAHLLKSEMFFSGEREWRTFLFPLFAFTYFSYALLAPNNWVNDWGLFLGAAACFAPLFPRPGKLMNPLFLAAMFLIGEGLLWGKYRPYMTDMFRDGVYTVHVAMASFYHYFRSYVFMVNNNQGSMRSILIVNGLSLLIGEITLRWIANTPILFVWGPAYFTVWVWLHQWMSDVFNWRKSR